MTINLMEALKYIRDTYTSDYNYPDGDLLSQDYLDHINHLQNTIDEIFQFVDDTIFSKELE